MSGAIEKFQGLSVSAVQVLTKEFIEFFERCPAEVQKWINAQTVLSADQEALNLRQAWQSRCPQITEPQLNLATYMFERLMTNTDDNMGRLAVVPHSLLTMPWACAHVHNGQVASIVDVDPSVFAAAAA